VENVIQANLLAATTRAADAVNEVYNVGFGESTSLNVLYRLIREKLREPSATPVYQDSRPGDIRHSCGDISKAAQRLGYEPAVSLSAGLDPTIAWYKSQAITSSP
jgi:UDP-N-acetylglucosamine 4-epimerase